MKAKNTVIRTTVYNCHDTLEERLAEQAELSFKAGEQYGYDKGYAQAKADYGNGG